MQVSLSTASLYLYPLRKTFALARRAGFDGIELVIGPEVEWRGPQYIRRLSSEYGLPILTVHPPLFGLPGWRGINASIEPYFDKALAIARGVGAPVLVVHLPHARRLDDAVGKPFLDKLIPARRNLDGTGPKFALENSSAPVGRDKGFILRSLPELRRFADAYDLALTMDTAHLGTWNLDLVRSIDYFDGRLANVHLSDLHDVPGWVMKRRWLHSYFRQHQLPGTGRLPLAAFVRELDARGYRGPVTYELSPWSLQIWSPSRVEQNLRRCAEFVRRETR